MIQSLGHKAVTDISHPRKPVWLLRRLIRRLKQLVVSKPTFAAELNSAVNVKLERFVRSQMQTTELYRWGQSPAVDKWSHYDTIVVGSDQIWRKSYADVASYLLDFTGSHHSIRRVAYAGSFGLDTLAEYDEQLIKQTAALAQKFDSISVRESSGVLLAKDHWKVDALQMPDPTLLMPADTYRALAASKTDARSPDAPYVASYLLDPDPRKTKVLRDLAASLTLTPFAVLPEPPRSVAEFQANPDSFIKPGIDEWLQIMSKADFILTDSFHGVAFSIILNRPFLAIGNESRGWARFVSVLEEFDLMNRLVSLESDLSVNELLQSDIDWLQVNRTLDDNRARGMNFLKANI